MDTPDRGPTTYAVPCPQCGILRYLGGTKLGETVALGTCGKCGGLGLYGVLVEQDGQIGLMEIRA